MIELISVEDRLPRNLKERFDWWVIPKPPEEAMCDGNGKPIIAKGAGFLFRGKYKTWDSLHKPTHWQPLPEPPKGE